LGQITEKISVRISTSRAQQLPGPYTIFILYPLS